MNGLKGKHRLGLGLIIVSIALGFAGIFWGVYSSFDALKMNESAGIGAVGADIYIALICSIGGIVGAIAGTLILIFGRARSDKE